jgi:hypothetical protein
MGPGLWVAGKNIGNKKEKGKSEEKQQNRVNGKGKKQGQERR